MDKLMCIALARLSDVFGDKKGVTAAEYGILLALVAVAIITAATTLGTKIEAMFNSAASAM